MAAPLIFQALCSLDGYVNDENGRFEFAAPDAEVHSFVNEGERAIGTYLYGRRLYDTMVAWETMSLDDQPAPIRDYALIWRAADKVIFSRSLDRVASAKTRIEREFDVDMVAELKSRSESPIDIGGPTLAANAFRAGLVDEIRLFMSPAIVGGGTRALPDNVKARLELKDERRFGNGTVYLSYLVRN